MNKKKLKMILIIFSIIFPIISNIYLKGFEFQRLDNIINGIFFLVMIILFSYNIYKITKEDGVFINELEYIAEYIKGIKNIEAINTRQELNNRFDKINKLKNEWESYTLSLCLIKNKEYSTMDVEEFINFEKIVVEKVNYKFINYLSQFFLGLGMLGTFLGLSLGLMELNIEKIDLSQLVPLITGTKTAFYTSLYGMYFSIIFSFFLNYHYGEIESKINILKTAINKLFPRFLNEKQTDILIQEIKELKKINIELKKGLEEEMINGMKEFHRSNIENTKEFSKLNKQNSETLLKVVSKNIDGLADSVSQSFEKRLTRIFSKDLIDSFDKLKKDLENVVKENVNTISKFNDNFQDLRNNFSQLNNENMKSYESLYKLNNAIFDQLKKQLSDTLDNIKGLENVNSSTIKALNLSDQFVKNLNDVNTSLKETSSNIKNMMENEYRIIKYWSDNKDLLNQLNRMNENSVSKLKKLDVAIEEYRNKFDKEHDKISENIVKQYEERLSKVIELFNKSINNLHNEITNYNSLMKKNEKMMQIGYEKMKELEKREREIENEETI